MGFFTESRLNELTIYSTNNTDYQYEHVSIEKRIETMSDTVYFVYLLMEEG